MRALPPIAGLASLLLAVADAEADADRLAGKWRCLETIAEPDVSGQTELRITFFASGGSRGMMLTEFETDGMAVTGLFQYLGEWRIEDGLLEERPTEVNTRIFEVNGEDRSGSEMAEAVKARLIEGVLPKKGIFETDDRLLLQGTEDGREVTCNRAPARP